MASRYPVKDCPDEGDGRPLVIISHGTIRWYGGHDDTAEALAEVVLWLWPSKSPGRERIR